MTYPMDPVNGHNTPKEGKHTAVPELLNYQSH